MLVIGISSAFAQPWADDQNGNPKKNFYEIQKAAQEYWKDKDITIKGKGWKPYKRWEWFWEQRVYPSGEFPSPMQNINEKNKFKDKKTGNKIQTVGDWVSLGPTTNGGGYGGLGRVNCVREDPSNSSVLWAGAASGGIWKSTNSGSSWTTTTDNLAVLGISDIAFHPTNSSIVYIATGDGDANDNYSLGVMKSTDGGASWNTTGLTWTENMGGSLRRLLINPSNPNILIVGGGSGIWRTTDGGVNWSQVTSSSVRDLEFKPNDPSVVYAGKYGSTSVQVIKSTDGGATWFNLTNGLPTSGVYRTAIGVSSANANYVYAFMSNNNDYGFYGLYRSTDAGSTWTLMSSSPNILGWNSNGSDTGGQGWYDLCIDVSQTNANEIYCGGVNLWKSTNGGSNWTNISYWTTSVHADQHDIWITPSSNRIYVGNDGGVYRSTNSGTNWSWISSGLAITQFYRIGTSATNANLVIGGTQDNGTKMISSGNWSDEIGGDGMEALIDYSNANIMYGELYYGNIQKSTDGGFSWGACHPSGSGGWVTPYVIHPTSTSTLFVGYSNVFKTTNGGTNWTQISSFTGSNLTVLHVAPSDANYIYASTGSSSLQRTTDGGTTWSSHALPTNLYLTYLAIHPTDPLKVWASFSGYYSNQKVYSSIDGGATWTNISGTGQLPNVPVNTIVYQKDYNNRLYIGTDVGVYYKDDNSGGWVDYSTNLPNVVVNELEIQYSSMKLRAGTYGRGLWEAQIPSTTITLNPPTLLSPSNGSTNTSVNPTLSWSSVTDALSYNVAYSLNADMSSATTTNVTTTSKNLSGLSQGKIYYWRVQAVNGGITSNWSSTWNFKTEITSLSTPVLSSPLNNATNISLTPTLSWQSVENATSYDVVYSINSDLSNGTTTNVTTTSLTLSGLTQNTVYYWSVQAKYASITSSYAATWNFKTLIPSLGTPVLVSPANNAQNVSTSPTLSWNAVSGATSYDIQYGTSSTFSGATTVNSTTTSKQITGLTKKTTYYWRVMAKNVSQTSPWSSSRKFKTSNSGKIGAWDEETISQSTKLEFYPNPFSNSTHFKLEVFNTEMINIVVTDIFGRNISTLMNETRNPGIYEFDFNANNLSNGVYYCHLIVGDEIQTMQMVIMK